MPFSKIKNLVVSNIKLSCTINLLDEKTISLNKEVEKSFHGNFTVVRKKYIYTIFKRRENRDDYHVNITKVPSTSQIETSIEELSNIITNSFIVQSYKIDNMTCSFDAGCHIPLMGVFDDLKKESFVKRIRFNPERFPGMFVTFESNTILLFSSGKMVIIGAKNIHSVEDNVGKILHFLNHYKAAQVTITP